MRKLRKSRNRLRPCSYNSDGWNVENAYFHYFGTSGNQEDGFSSVALIEDEFGQMNEVEAWKIKFEDIVSIGDKVKMRLQNGEHMDFTVRDIDGDYIVGENSDGGFWTNVIGGNDIFVYEELDRPITITIK